MFNFQYGEYKLITIKRTAFGTGSLATGIFDNTGMIIWYVTLLLLCLLVMICAPSRPFGFIEVMGVFLDQGMARTKTRILLPLLMASFSFSMMYKSIMISHLIKPAVLKGPENIKDLIENFPDMIISYYDAGYAPYEPMYAKHPERFNLSMGIETPYPHEVQAFLNGKLAVLEHTPEFFEWTFRPEKVGCRSELGKKPPIFLNSIPWSCGMPFVGLLGQI